MSSMRKRQNSEALPPMVLLRLCMRTHSMGVSCITS